MFGSPEPSPTGDSPDAPAGAMESVRPGGVGGTARGRPRARAAQRRQVRVGLRLGAREAEDLAAAADRAGMTAAGYAAAAALAAAASMPPPRARPAPNQTARPVLHELIVARLELVRVGTNLNQIARAVNESGGQVPPMLDRVLVQLDASIRQVDDRTMQVMGHDQP